MKGNLTQKIPFLGLKLKERIRKSWILKKIRKFLAFYLKDREYYISLRVYFDKKIEHRKNLQLESDKHAESLASQFDIEKGFCLFNQTLLKNTDQLYDACWAVINKNVTRLEDFYQYNNQNRNKTNKGSYFFNILQPEDLLEHPILMNFALQKDVVAFSNYKRDFFPRLTSIGIKVSIPNNNQIGSQNYHFDPLVDCRKLFFGLTDVTLENGPFTFIPKNKSEKIFKENLYSLGRNFSDEYIGDLDNEKVICKSEKKQGFVCDTSRCLHQGSRVKSGIRIVYSAFYSDYMNYNWHKSKGLLSEIWLKDYPEIRERFSKDSFSTELLTIDPFGR